MEAALIGALIGSVVTMFGWIANYRLNRHYLKQQYDLEFTKHDRTERLLAAIRHKEQQMEKLYGPLAFRVKEGERAYSEVLHLLGRKSVFVGDETLSPADWDIWIFWVERFFMPNNAKIVSLIRENAHLIEGDGIPPSFSEFLDYHYSWKLHHQQHMEQKSDYSGHARFDWPKPFSEHVLATLENLKASHSGFMAELEADESIAPERAQSPSAPPEGTVMMRAN